MKKKSLKRLESIKRTIAYWGGWNFSLLPRDTKRILVATFSNLSSTDKSEALDMIAIAFGKEAARYFE